MIYSSFKASHHLQRIERLRKKQLILPTQVQIDLTNKCNHRCPYCFYRYDQNDKLNALFNRKDEIPYERMIRLLKEFRELQIPAVQYTGGGEPLLYPRLKDILQETIDNGIEYSLVTNGNLIDYGHLDLLKKATWIRVSLDASTPETYIKSQGADHFKETIQAIEMLARECKNNTVGISFVANPINWKEIYQATVLARSLGVDNIRLSVAYTPKGARLYADYWDEIEKLARLSKQLESKDFKVFNLITSHLDNLDYKHKGYDFCGYQHFTAVIGADQIVYPCCTLKYNSIIPFGSLKDKTFYEIWTGDKRKAWLKRDHLKEVCDNWPCWMDKKNEFISYLVHPNPPHKNFV